MLVGCGNSWEQKKKNWASDYGDLERDVTVINALTKDTLFSYSGPCYINTAASPGDITFIYYVNGQAKKADFLGEFVIFTAIEK